MTYRTRALVVAALAFAAGPLAAQGTQTAAPAATLRAALGRTPSVHEVTDALFAAVRSRECPTATEFYVDQSLEIATRRLLDRYVDDRWTWRR